MGKVAELLLDVESLFSLYTREAMCLNVPGQGLNKPTEKPAEELLNKSTEKPAEEIAKPESEEDEQTTTT